MKKFAEYPKWVYGPKGESKIIEHPDHHPAGWHDHPSKHHRDTAPSPAKLGTGPVEEPFAPNAGDVRPIAHAANPGDANHSDQTAELDADGWAWDEALHAATKSKTNAGLWRMKVGVSRPAPKPGFPKPALDL